MNLMKTKARISSRSYQSMGKKTFVGRVHYYENGQFLFSESTGIHRLTALDAQLDAHKICYERIGATYN